VSILDSTVDPTEGTTAMTDEHVPADAGTPGGGDAPAAADANPDKRWNRLILLVIALGAFMRFVDLRRQSMWYDELFTVFTSMKSLPGLLKVTAADTSPPLFYIAESGMIRLFGKGEIAMRFLPAFAGVLTIWVVYLAGKKLFSPKASFWAAALFAIAYMPLRYAQEARAYSFMMLFAALGLLTLLRLAEKPGFLNAAAFCLALTALVYNHVYGVFGGFALVLAMLVVPGLRRRTRWWGVGAAAVAAAFFVPWGLVILNQQIRTVGDWVGAGSWPIKPPANLLLEMWSAISSFTPWPYPEVWSSVVFAFALLAGLFAVGSKETARGSSGETRAAEKSEPAAKRTLEPFALSDRDVAVTLAIVMLVPLVVALGISKFVLPIQELRSYVVCIPAAYLLAAFGATRLRPIVSFVLLMALLASAIMGVPVFYSAHNKGYYREAVQYLLANNAQDERIIVSSNYLPLDLNIYCLIEGYDRQFRLDTVKWWHRGEELDKDLAPLLKNRQDVWIVTAFVPLADDGTTTFDASMNRQDGWRLVDTQNFDDRPKVEHWVLEGATSTAP